MMIDLLAGREVEGASHGHLNDTLKLSGGLCLTCTLLFMMNQLQRPQRIIQVLKMFMNCEKRYVQSNITFMGPCIVIIF
jgi:hypothetical protein